MGRASVFTVILIVFTGVLLAPHPGRAFERDTHYYMSFALSLSTCYDWDEAHIIASADWMTDGNRTTVAEMNPVKKRNKRSWHAFGHSAERYNELWVRVLSEPDHRLRLVKLGQFLHFLQDWEAHARYPVGLGHATATIRGRDPDSMARSEPRTAQATQATLDHLAIMCSELDRLPGGLKNPDQALPELTSLLNEDGLVRDLIDSSIPNWRARKMGGLTKKGRQVLAQNILRIEQFVDRRVAPIQEKRVPEDFLPGTDEHGIPEPLELEYDRDGGLLNDLAELMDDAGEQPDHDEQDPGDDRVRIKRARQVDDGWLVRIEVKNTGDEPLPDGEVTFLAVDAVTEELLGETSRPIPDLDPGEEAELEVIIPTSRTAETVLLGISARVEHDYDQYNNELWFVTSEDLEELEEHLEEVAESTPTLPANVDVEFVGSPQVWVTGAGSLCVTSKIRTSSKDPTHELEPARIALLSEQGVAAELTGWLPRVWSITPTERGKPAAVKTFACFDPRTELCGLMETEDPSSELIVTARLGSFQRTATIEVDDRLAEQVAATCLEGE
jgi:hypothetical protein